MTLTIGLSGMFDLCTFDSPYNLGGRGVIGFNVDLVLLGMLLFFTRILVFCAISWIFVKLFVAALSERRFFIFFFI